MSALELARAAFRDGARALDPETFLGEAPPQVVRAWLCIQTVRTQPKWVRAAADTVQDLARNLESIPDNDVADWVEVCCRGWVQQAIGPFRNAARLLLPRVTDELASVPALLGWWRITGERAPLHRALAVLRSVSTDEPSDGIALRLGFQATADEELRRRGAQALGGELGRKPCVVRLVPMLERPCPPGAGRQESPDGGQGTGDCRSGDGGVVRELRPAVRHRTMPPG